ncbi:MAG: tetratricopeptide repeat protein [Myxococcota bacterium]
MVFALAAGCQSDAERAEALYASALPLTGSAPAEAIALLREAVGLNPQLERAHRELAELHLQQGDVPSAMDAASRALAIQETAEARAVRGQGYVAEENWEAARQDLVRAQEIDLTRTDLAMPLGLAHRELGDAEEALQSFERALEADRENRAAALEIAELQLARANELLASDAPFWQVETALRRAQVLSPADITEAGRVAGDAERWALESDVDDLVQRRWAEVGETLRSVEERVSARQHTRQTTREEAARENQERVERLILEALGGDSGLADTLSDGVVRNPASANDGLLDTITAAEILQTAEGVGSVVEAEASRGRLVDMGATVE